MTPLVLVAHGSRGRAATGCVHRLADAVRLALPGVEVRLAFVDVHPATVAAAVAGLDGAVVLPAFLASGYHVRTDLPAQLAACGATADRFPVTAALGPHRLLARAAAGRLVQAGWRAGDAVVLAAAGSSDPVAIGEVRAAARMLSALLPRPVRVGYAATAGPGVEELVARLRAAGEARVAVASWLLAPGVFHARVARAGADVVAAPLGAHRDVVAAVLARYRAAARGCGAAAAA